MATADASWLDRMQRTVWAIGVVALLSFLISVINYVQADRQRDLSASQLASLYRIELVQTQVAKDASEVALYIAQIKAAVAAGGASSPQAAKAYSDLDRAVRGVEEILGHAIPETVPGG